MLSIFSSACLLVFFKFLFIYLFMAVLGLRFCARAFSSCGKREPLLIAVRGPLTIAASLLWGTGSRHAGSVIVAHGPSCSTACGNFPDQGSNPCPLHWQADSQPLRHQGSPRLLFFYVSGATVLRNSLFACVKFRQPDTLRFNFNFVFISCDRIDY